jgi:hypothetical protein
MREEAASGPLYYTVTERDDRYEERRGTHSSIVKVCRVLSKMVCSYLLGAVGLEGLQHG